VNKAAAEALFRQALELMTRGDTVMACARFQASQSLEPALGTLLHLAHCYEKIGKTASAWAAFSEAESLAQARKEHVRAEIAAARASALDAKLSRIQLVTTDVGRLERLEISLDGVTVPPGSYDTPLPLDPGPHEIVARAPGYRIYSQRIHAALGPSLIHFAIPRLQRSDSSGGSAPLEPGATDSAPPNQADMALDSPEPGDTQRIIAWISGGVGIAGLATGAVLGYVASQRNAESLDECRENDASACSPQGVELREQAHDFARGSTIALGAGGVLLVGGFITYMSAPSRDERSVSVTPRVGLGTVGVTLGGRF
jgi:hypothetical protein